MKMNPKRILVTGGRHYDNVPYIWQTLDKLDTQWKLIRTIIEGASDDVTGPYKGADYWAHQWALARGRVTVRVHAEWETHGKQAGPIRNKLMIEQKPTLVLAFQGGKGTANMKYLARKAKIRVYEV